jgi:hypothetical protein
VAAVRLDLDTSGKSPAYLHRRKKFRARAGKLVAGFLNRTAAAFFGACHSSHVSSSSQDASRRAAVRTIKIGMICSENRFPLVRIMPARTRERAGTRRGKDPRPPAASASDEPPWIGPGGMGFAPEMIAQKAIMPYMVHPQREASMTAYLISLALAGLVAIAVWEGLA